MSKQSLVYAHVSRTFQSIHSDPSGARATFHQLLPFLFQHSTSTLSSLDDVLTYVLSHFAVRSSFPARCISSPLSLTICHILRTHPLLNSSSFSSPTSPSYWHQEQ
jgi:hypothetical protein